MELFDVDELTISEWALREGMVLDAIGRHDPVDWSDDPRAIRRASVQALARRCSWPEAHSRHVARLSLELFDQTRELHGLDDDDRELLEYAALLHDIGEHVVARRPRPSRRRTSSHHGQLRGFDPEEILVLTALVRWHRRGEPEGARRSRRRARRRRARARPPPRRAAPDRRRPRPQPQAGRHRRRGAGRARHSCCSACRRTGDPELELWGARRKRELFEKVFDRELELTAHPSG